MSGKVSVMLHSRQRLAWDDEVMAQISWVGRR